MNIKSEIVEEFMETGISSSCPVIDMHGHYGPHQGIYFPDPYAEGMIKTLKSCGTELIVCSSHKALYGDPAAGNQVIQEVVNKYPEYFMGYCVINPNYPEISKKSIETFHSKKEFLGFKIHPTSHNYSLVDENYRPLFEYADDNKSVILSHTWGNRDQCGPDQVRKVVQKYNNIIFLMGHAGYGEWEKSAEIVKEFPNVYLELTAAYSVGGVVEYYVNEVGSENIIFGTDLPWFDPHYGIGCVIFSKITDEDRRNILFKNAKNILSRVRQ